MACYLLVFIESETFARDEMECPGISSAVEKAYHFFNERPNLRVLESWQDDCMVFKLERHRTVAIDKDDCRRPTAVRSRPAGRRSWWWPRWTGSGSSHR